MLLYDSSDPTHFVIPSTAYNQFAPGTYTVSYYVSFSVETSGEYSLNKASSAIQTFDITFPPCIPVLPSD